MGVLLRRSGVLRKAESAVLAELLNSTELVCIKGLGRGKMVSKWALRGSAESVLVGQLLGLLAKGPTYFDFSGNEDQQLSLLCLVAGMPALMTVDQVSVVELVNKGLNPMSGVVELLSSILSIAQCTAFVEKKI